MAEPQVEPLVHRWEIQAREYRRHEQRRGRRHAFESLDPRRTALVVIDMVPFFVAESGFVRGIVPRINETAAVLRSHGGAVAWVVPAVGSPSSVDEEFYGLEVAAAYGGSGGTGPLRDRLWHELDVEADDLVVDKSAPSAFFTGRCELHARLAARGIDSVLVAGTVANVCCEATVRDARTLGYRVVMLADANAAPTDEMLNATLRTVYRSFGDVRPASEISDLLSGAVSDMAPGPVRGRGRMRRDEQILEAAADLFLKHGFHNVTLDEIGEQVGVTGPAIYRHFSGKDELLASLIDQTMDHLLLLLDRTDDAAEPAAVLDALVRAQVEFALTDRRRVTIYAREGQLLPDTWRRHVNRRQREHIGRWVSAMTAVYPHRSSEELHSAAHACIGMTLSVAQWPRDALRTPDLETLLYELVQGALVTLAPAAPDPR